MNRPLQTSQIRTNYKSEFAQSLEPWIGKPLPPIPTSQSQSILLFILKFIYFFNTPYLINL